MNTDLLAAERAAAFFAEGESFAVKPTGEGLINQSFLVEVPATKPLLLQRLNTNVFKRPGNVQANYETVSTFLLNKGFFLPTLVKTKDGSLLWKNKKDGVWRAFEYVPNSYSPNAIQNKKDAAAVAGCFGHFTAALAGFPVPELKVIIPRFHDLSFRFRQFEEAAQGTVLPLDAELKDLYWELMERKSLVDVYNRFNDESLFPLRVMHHDCKVNNVLFDKSTQKIICPVDLDTVMPGKFFSDLGDMVRTICCTVDENSTDWDNIAIRKDYYKTVTDAYLSSFKNIFTKAEQEHLHYSGLLLTYMQSLRFLTDYLNGNVYYKVKYSEQNYHRAKNQLLLLKSLENYLQKKKLYSPA